jgi:RNA 3'-terminal phosphate cyclase (ATP)
MLEVDGAQHSGSGTLVRTSVAIAALLGEALRLINIRAKRNPPGLRPQHLRAVQAVAELCGGTLEGAAVGAEWLIFRPGQTIRPGAYRWDIGTAGSTTMLALTVLPVIAFAGGPGTESRLTIEGGLFQDFAPSPFHTQEVLLPLLARLGLEARLRIVRPGYVPAGDGIIELTVRSVHGPLRPMALPSHHGGVQTIRAISLASHLASRRVAERMAESFQAALKQRGLRAYVEIVNDTLAAQPGAALAAFAYTKRDCILGADRAGEVRRSAESIGRDVARLLLADLDSGASVDRFTADQLILYAALADGTSDYTVPEVTDHVQSNLWLIEHLLGPRGARVELQDRRIRITGIGYRGRSG